MSLYPRVEVVVTVGTWTGEGDALPDTGYDGAVIIPIAEGWEIDAAPVEDTLYLADLREVTVDAWDGELELGGRIFVVGIRAFGNQFIVGRQVLDEMEICFEFGKRVRLGFAEAPPV